MKCSFCGEEITRDDAYINLLNHPSGASSRKYHADCYEPEPGDEMDYWPPAGEFPSDDDLQRQEMLDEKWLSD